jgi:nickel transport protein
MSYVVSFNKIFIIESSKYASLGDFRLKKSLITLDLLASKNLHPNMLSKILTRALLSLSFLATVSISPALAHVVWFNLENNRHELLFGHPESGPEPITVGKFQSATAYNSDRVVILSSPLIESSRIFVEAQGNISALTAFYDNGFWVRYSDGNYENLTREQAAAIGFQNVTNFVKYTKALYDWNSALAQPFGLPLEIIALQNPFSLQTGDNLPIQVFLNGSVITNPLVEYLGQVVSVDTNGTALIPIGNGGLQVIEASYTDPNAINPGVSYAATFTAQSVPEPFSVVALTLFGAAVFTRKRR